MVLKQLYMFLQYFSRKHRQDILCPEDTLDPDDESKIGALAVLKDLSEHLGLRLTQRDLKEVDYEARHRDGTNSAEFRTSDSKNVSPSFGS